ncbi:hypothetical protein BSK20_03645 [SR1 bacterium human oral taxon HOT-345]|nr:hypothetical protein BSK20_03645 [SR1 bacterium human oral taxon HOT-345]
MKKYGVCRGIAGIHIGKLNKKGTEFLDKETLTRQEVLGLLADCINFLLDGDEYSLDIKCNGELEFQIVRYKKS